MASPSRHPERVCAVVVTYNRVELLRECLTALESQTRPVDRILVVDNKSTDGTPEIVEREHPGADMLRLPRTTLIHKLRVLEQSAA